MASHFYYHDVKWIKVYKNGDDYTPAVKFLVFRKYTRSFESLLNSLTLRLKPPFGAVRNLYTPLSGIRVRSLDDLKPNQAYVAAGNEKYRKLSYNGLSRFPDKTRRRHSYMEVTPVIHSRIKVASRYKQELANLDAITIFVYRNGDDISPPRVVALTRKDMRTWDVALIRISERLLGNLTGCIQKLYSLEGRHLRNCRELKNGEFYVGALVGEPYRAVPYGLVSSASSRNETVHVLVANKRVEMG